MNIIPVGDWRPRQQQRLATFGVLRCVDVHCHCLPGLDDGPASLQEAVELCRALVDDGITTVIATPHQLGSYDRLNTAGQIRQAVAELTSNLAQRNIPLEIFPGGDVRIDERLPKLLDAGEIGTVADAGRHLLIELPHELFVDPLPTIEMLQQRRLQAIVTHPERYRYLQGSNEHPRAWVAAGAVIQITAGSLVGDFGTRAMDHAWKLVQDGLVSLVATDSHDATRRPPRLSAALRLLSEQIGDDQTRLIALDNPLLVFEGKPIALP